MKPILLTLTAAFSLSAFAAINVSVEKTMAKSSEVESVQLINALTDLGAKGFVEKKSGTHYYQVLGAITKAPAGCAQRDHKLIADMAENRVINGGLNNVQIEMRGSDSECALKTPADQLRSALLKWGANRLGDENGTMAFKVDCELPKTPEGIIPSANCFVELEHARD